MGCFQCLQTQLVSFLLVYSKPDLGICMMSGEADNIKTKGYVNTFVCRAAPILQEFKRHFASVVLI